VRRFFRLLASYFWWTHPRGSIHYDVMVTLILLFVFLAPMKINFRDKPTAPAAHPNQIVAYSDGQGGFAYEVPAAAVPAHAGPVEPELSQALQPVAGNVTVSRYQLIRGPRGDLLAYRVWVHR
jgi:hypothetical protein